MTEPDPKMKTVTLDIPVQSDVPSQKMLYH